MRMLLDLLGFGRPGGPAMTKPQEFVPRLLSRSALLLIAFAPGGCSVEQLVFEVQATVHDDLLNELLDTSELIAVSYGLDSQSEDAIGFACREQDHPLREDGLYHRSRRYEGGGYYSGQGVEEITDTWDTRILVMFPDCTTDQFSVTVDLRSASGAESCDSLSGMDDTATLALGDVVATTTRTISSEEFGECQETGTRFGTVVTSQFAEGVMPVEPAVIDLTLSDLTSP